MSDLISYCLEIAQTNYKITKEQKMHGWFSEHRAGYCLFFHVQIKLIAHL